MGFADYKTHLLINLIACRRIDLFLMGLSDIDQLFLLMLSTDYADYSVYIMQALCSKVVNATSKSFYFLPFVSIFSLINGVSPRFTPRCTEGGWFHDIPQINHIKFS